MGSILARSNETMHENTNNPTNPKGRRQTQYVYNHQFSKLHQKWAGVYQFLSNVGKGRINGVRHYRGWNKAQNRLHEI